VTECVFLTRTFAFCSWLAEVEQIFESIRKTLFAIYQTEKFFSNNKEISLRKKRKFKVHPHLFFTLYEHLLVILLGVYKHLSGLKVLIRRPGVNIPSRDVRNIYWNLLKRTGVINSAKGRAANKK
jgi:hypothetical protein